MSKRDLFHEAVRNALIKDGWTITDDPLHLKVTSRVDVYIDLGAEKILAAEKSGEKIAVEIKSFAGTSDISELHTALGQFLIYRNALRRKDSQQVLFLAIPSDTYENFFQDEFISETLEQFDLKLLVYNSRTEEIAKWIK